MATAHLLAILALPIQALEEETLLLKLSNKIRYKVQAHLSRIRAAKEAFLRLLSFLS